MSNSIFFRSSNTSSNYYYLAKVFGKWEITLYNDYSDVREMNVRTITADEAAQILCKVATNPNYIYGDVKDVSSKHASLTVA